MFANNVVGNEIDSIYDFITFWPTACLWEVLALLLSMHSLMQQQEL